MSKNYETILIDDNSIEIGIKDNHVKIETIFNDDIISIIEENKFFKRINKANKNKIIEHYYENNKFIYVFENELNSDNNDLSYLCMEYKTKIKDKNAIIECKITDKFTKLDKHYKQIEIEELIINVEDKKIIINLKFNKHTIPLFLGKKLAKLISKLISNTKNFK